VKLFRTNNMDTVRQSQQFIMAALCNRGGIIFLPCGFFFLGGALYFCPVVSSFFLSIFFPRLISAVTDWMSAILPHMVCLSANLRCRSETCCTWLAEKYRTQKLAKKSPSGHYRTTLSGYIFAIKAHIDNRKKNLTY